MRLVKNFQWYLFYEDGGTTYYHYVDSNGAIQTTMTKTPLRFAPKGWRDQALVWERGFVYHGIFQTYSVPLKFVKDGAKILRYLYITFGTEPNCKLLIEKYNDSLAIQAYETYYLGELDFSRYSSEKDFVNVEVMEGGFLSKLKAKESTSIEIPITNHPNRVWIYMDGLEMVALFNFTGIEQPVDTSPPTFIGSDRENFPTLLWFSTEGHPNGDTNPKGNDHIGAFSKMFSQNYAGSDMITLSSANKWIIHNKSGTNSYDYNIKGSITIDHSNSVGSTRQMNVYAYVNNAAAVGTAVTKYVIANGGVIPASGTLTETVEIDYNITLLPNEQLWLWFRHTGTPGEVSYHLVSFNIVASTPNTVKPSIIPAIRSIDVCSAIVADIDSTTFIDDTLLGLDANVRTKVLTCGDAIRGLEGAIMKTNITDFYQSVNARFNTCMKFDKAANTVRILDKAAAFDEATQIMDLGVVSNFKHYPLTEEMFAKYVTGYNDVKYDGVSGKDEFNITLNFQSDLQRITTEKNIRSDYGADMYSIELTRGNFTEKLQADSNNDNIIFWIDIESSASGTVPTGLPGAGEPMYNLNRSGYTISQGLYSPHTAFNIWLSPKAGLLKHGNYINSVLYPQLNLPSAKLTFKSASKDQSNGEYLIWVDGGSNVFDERADVALVDLDDPIFYAIVFEFDCLTPQAIYTIMASNPYGKIRFVANAIELFGFLLKVQDEPVTKPKQTYKLLCSISSDISKLF